MTELIIKPKLIGGLSSHRYQNSNGDTPYQSVKPIHSSNRSVSNLRGSETKSLTSSVQILPKLDKSVTERSIASLNASFNDQRSKTIQRSVSMSHTKKIKES